MSGRNPGEVVLGDAGDITLSEVARVAISLVHLDPVFAPAAYDIGRALGARMATPAGRTRALPAAVAALDEACRRAGFVDLDLIHHTGADARIRLRGCRRILRAGAPVVTRAVCDFDCGLFEGFLREALDGPTVMVTETSCIGRGEPCCEFQIRTAAGAAGQPNQSRAHTP